MSRGRRVKDKWLVWRCVFWEDGKYKRNILPFRPMTSADRRTIKRIGIAKFLNDLELGWFGSTVEILEVN